MRKLALFFALACRLSAQSASSAKPDAPESHDFVISNFHTESGVTLPQVHVIYGTYGHLNAAGDNAVLLPSHYMANFHGYEWLIGPNRALDNSNNCSWWPRSCSETGDSSSPSNTPEPFHGPRFPVMTIRDNMEAVHRLLTGRTEGDPSACHSSAFPWARNRPFNGPWAIPTFASRIVATSGTAKTYPHGVVRLEGQIAALTADAAFQGGDYTAPPAKGSGGVRYRVGRLALLAGMVAQRNCGERTLPRAPLLKRC